MYTKLPWPERPMLLCRLDKSDSDITASASPSLPKSSKFSDICMPVAMLIGCFLLSGLCNGSLVRVIINFVSIQDVSVTLWLMRNWLS